MTKTPVPTVISIPLSPCGDVFLGEDCGHGRGCPPPEVTPPSTPTVQVFALVNGRLQEVEAPK